MATFFNGAGAFTVTTLSTGGTTTYVEDGVTFTLSVTSGTIQVQTSNAFVGVSGLGTVSAVVDMTFKTASGQVFLSGTPRIAFSSVQNGNITALTTGGSQQFGGAQSGSTVTLSPTTITGIRFTASPNAGLIVAELSGTIVCFAEGTQLATPDGPKAIEDLEPGDQLTLSHGGETVVKWVGLRTVSKTFANPLRVNPICIKAGTLGNARDLFVSPDHGVALDGYLVNASALVNGETIYQVAEMPGDFTYYHVETEAHELILAEGVPTESYLDTPSRDVFDNGDERAGASNIPEMDLPRISSRRMLPVSLAHHANRVA